MLCVFSCHPQGFFLHRRRLASSPSASRLDENKMSVLIPEEHQNVPLDKLTAKINLTAAGRRGRRPLQSCALVTLSPNSEFVLRFALCTLHLNLYHIFLFVHNIPMGDIMTTTDNISFFLGANTPEGFYSLFSELHFPEDGWRLYIIKGGPGTGKSTLMKRIAAAADKKGLFCERIYCSSDPESLDAVIIPSVKISIADGTPPHVIEPKYPGVSEKFVDLGLFRDDRKLKASRDEIIETAKENSFYHKKCVDFLLAALSCRNDTASVVIPLMKIAAIHKFSEKLADKMLCSLSDTAVRMKKRIVSAVTPCGITEFPDTVKALSEKRVVLYDSFGCAASVILKFLTLRAAEKGIDGYCCYDFMNPVSSPVALILPSLNLSFQCVKGKPSENSECALSVNCMRFYDSAGLSRHKNRLAFNTRSENEMISGAAECLIKAKATHDRLEKYYIGAMDFERMNEFSEKLIEEIFD